MRSSSESVGCTGLKALTMASLAEDELDVRQPQVFSCSSGNRTSACCMPPLAKKRTESGMSAMTPYGFGKSPSTGAPPAASARNAEYGSAVGSMCE